jgi:hypothetical protein
MGTYPVHKSKFQEELIAVHPFNVGLGKITVVAHFYNVSSARFIKLHLSPPQINSAFRDDFGN